MFDSIFNSVSNTVLAVFIIVLVNLVAGILATLILSIKMRGTKGFFITNALMPMVVALIIALTEIFLSNSSSGTTARIVTIAVALGLIRFRSINGRAEEMLVLLVGVGGGLVSGLGYVFWGAIFQIITAGLYVLLVISPLFGGKRFARERLLKITVPESLDYSDIFNQTFDHYLKEVELVEVKTTGMGSMFRLSYRIRMKNPAEEKEMIDEIRTKNGNLEISVLPYVEPKEL